MYSYAEERGQTVEWIKMPLGKEVGLGPGHTVLHGDPLRSGDPAPPPPTAASPHFRPVPIVAKRSPISATAELLLEDQIAKCFANRLARTISVVPDVR